MAIWETTLPSTIWQPAAIFDGALDSTTSTIVKIDNEESGGILEAGDSVVLSFQGVSGKTGGKFLGTVTVDGVKYPVVEADFGFIKSRFIVGLDSSKTTTEKLAETALDTSDFTVCFFPGTLIATPSGERKVEDLASGDPVLIGDSGVMPSTWFGRKFARAVSVKWTGRQTVSTIFGPVERLMPIRFAAGSLGGGGNPFCRIVI